MGERRDQIEVSSDDATVPPVEPPLNKESVQFGQSLLHRTIDQLRRLRDDYRQARAWLERMEQQLARREVQISRHLHQALARTAQARPPGSDADPVGWPPSPEPAENHLSLRVQTLGRFEVYCHGQPIPLCSSRKGRALFRYLATRPERRAAKDVLLELFWPGEEAEKAGHKLHIAVSALRQALNEAVEMGQKDGEPVLFEDDHYLLNPALSIHLDADAFTTHCRAGERLERENRVSEAVAEYEAALALYRSDFLTEDLYADWSLAARARLEETYLTTLGRLAAHYLDQDRFMETVSCCRRILAKDSFREDAYRQLMRCYSRMGRRNQALREYLACEEVLQKELGVRPMRETAALYEQIVREEAV
jgi:DNA-binding SARP family transcriptional activator